VATGYVPSVVGGVVVASGTNTGVQVQLALPNPTQISIVPNGATVTVGGGQNLSLVDQNGMPVTGATWSVDDSTIAFIDATDNSVAGVAVGTTTVRAAWQGYQASIPVNVIALANVLWSSQLSGQQGPALPLAKTGTGPDFVYTDGSSLYGVSYDNGVMWQQSLQGLPSLNFSQAAADENGDFVIPNGYGMTKFYGTNGLPEWTREVNPDTGIEFYNFAVDSQGNVFAVVTDSANNYSTSLQEFASATGQVLVFQPLPNNSANIDQDVNTTPVSVLSDGSVQVQYLTSGAGSAPFPYALHLVTLTANSASDVVLDSTLIGLFGGVFIDSGANLPDGNGGTVNVWGEKTTTFFQGGGWSMSSGTTFFRDSATGTTFQSSNVFGASNFVLGSTGLLYFLGAYPTCSSNDPSPCQNVLVAMNLNTGTEAWRFTLDETAGGGPPGQEVYGDPVAATNDGGLVVTPFDYYYSSGAARVDTSGNVTVDSTLSPYVPSGFANSLNYLGGPDGTLWASSTSAAVVSDIVDADTTDGDTISDWGTKSGKANAFRAEMRAHFKDASANLCGGFDGKPGLGKHAPAILVVPVGGSNQVILKVKGNWQNYTLTSDTSTVTFAPSAPTGNSTTFTINGGSNPTLARVKVYDANGNRQATLRVSVKPQYSTALDLYPVTDPNNNLVGSAPSSANVSTELQNILGTYANLSFTVNLMPRIGVHYDFNNDGALQEQPALNSEQTAINSYIQGNGGNPNDIWVSYVADINPHTTEGFTPVSLATQCGLNVEYIRNNTDTSLNGQPWVTAHETGHELCLPHNTKDVNDLMTPYQVPGTGPCRLHAGEWNKLNPTGNQNQPLQWELAPPQPADR
jgi:hypothetical protein